MQIAAGHNLSVSFVTDELFRDVSFSIESNARIGLVGSNGSGKTTLLKLLSGQNQPSEGQIVLSRECSISFMEQFLQAAEDETTYAATEKVFQPLIDLEQRLQQVNSRLEQESSEQLLAEQATLHERYAEMGGYTYQGRTRATLLGLGFSEDDLQLPVSALSGGQRSKAALARALLLEANLLLLDEPTNHLDIESVQWLEGYLANYRGALVVVSHDRYFLDKVTNETWHMHHKRMQQFKGNYTEHLLQMEDEKEAVQRRYSNQLREIRRVEGIIAQQRRFNQARNYVTIASKEKQLNRLREDLVAPEKKQRELGFSFDTPPPGGNDVLEINAAAKGFGTKQLFRNVDMRINRGERIFLLGPNGSGKSTIMRIIRELEALDAGSMRLGVNIFPVYYDQMHGHISGSQTVLQYFTDAYPRMTQTRIRTMLGSFLFSGDDVEKTLSMLSGGEKARLELMKLILQPANLLLLDEPTNHLDIASCEAVERALQEYPGAMLVISHDRYLINKLADRIYYLTADGMVESLGDYDDFLAVMEARRAEALPQEGTSAQPENQPRQEENSYQRRKEEQAALRKRERRMAELNKAIAALEQRLSEIDSEMNAPANATDYQRLMELQQLHEAAEEEYLLLMEELEELER